MRVRLLARARARLLASLAMVASGYALAGVN
jgi:hypothetical protein